MHSRVRSLVIHVYLIFAYFAVAMASPPSNCSTGAAGTAGMSGLAVIVMLFSESEQHAHTHTSLFLSCTSHVACISIIIMTMCLVIHCSLMQDLQLK